MKRIEFTILASKQVREFIVYLVLGIVVIVLDFSFVLKNQWEQFLSLKVELREAREKILETSVVGFRTGSLKERLGELKKDVTEKKKGILEEEQIPDLMGEISKLADEVNLKIMSMVPQKEIRNSEKFTTSEQQEYYILPISLVARGAYHSLGHFLNRLEKSLFLIKITNIDIIPQATIHLNVEHNIRLSLSIFVVKKI